MCVRLPLDHSHIKCILKFDHSRSVINFPNYLFLGDDTHNVCTHKLQVEFSFRHVWLEALTLGQPYRFPGTAVLSAGCQAGTGKTLKSWGLMHLLQFTGMCQQ